MTPVVAVVSAVADAAGTDPLELPALSNAINPEALNDLVGAERSSSLQSVSFEYAGYDVVVSGTGDIEVAPSE
ncbi:HalOD1 output domain-containing protein [Natronococcus amylolyticus]|uniref:HalOD1 output domain-containing protein n=1 Tax=Natronococcus amylolyticus TaxID=44470 RepID=UPI0009FBE7BB|nr:HalOD1 output domain-containing protein [Natronococcus amylolyticus]